MVELCLEDFSVGQKFTTGEVTVGAQEIKAFASQFDPQPFHLDEQRAASSFFGGLVASGWHTAGLTMRLIVESELKIAGGMIGVGAEKLEWPLPVRPGDVLHAVSEVLEVRASKSRPELGIVKVRAETKNQQGETVMVMVTSLVVPRRLPSTS
jgi:acyl dehydratase